MNSCTYQSSPRYISALEERIAFLEARMPDHAEDHFANNNSDNSAAVSDTIDESSMGTQARRRESSNRSARNSMSDDTEVDDRSSLVDGVAYLSLCASGTTDATSEPYYVGSSSGATIARVIQQSIFKGTGNRQINEAAIASNQRCAETTTSPPTPPLSTSAHSESLQLGLPDLEQARMLFDMFFERIHTRWPLLDRVVYEDLFAKQHIPGALTVVERSIFHLIYAITARFMSLTRKLHSVDSEVREPAMTLNSTLRTDWHSVILWQPQSQWIAFWSSTALRPSNSLYCLESMVSVLHTAQEPGHRSGTPLRYALKWVCTGSLLESPLRRKQEKQRFAAESSGPATVSIVPRVPF
jgi:hypothetical protein